MTQKGLQASLFVLFVALSLRSVDSSSVLLQNATLGSNREILATGTDAHTQACKSAVSVAASVALQVRIDAHATAASAADRSQPRWLASAATDAAGISQWFPILLCESVQCLFPATHNTFLGGTSPIGADLCGR
jgi:hypothetical protein